MSSSLFNEKQVGSSLRTSASELNSLFNMLGHALDTAKRASGKGDALPSENSIMPPSAG